MLATATTIWSEGYSSVLYLFVGECSSVLILDCYYCESLQEWEGIKTGQSKQAPSLKALTAAASCS